MLHEYFQTRYTLTFLQSVSVNQQMNQHQTAHSFWRWQVLIWYRNFLLFMEEKFITMFTKLQHVDTLIIKTNASLHKQNIPNHLFNTTVW